MKLFKNKQGNEESKQEDKRESEMEVLERGRKVQDRTGGMAWQSFSHNHFLPSTPDSALLYSVPIYRRRSLETSCVIGA